MGESILWAIAKTQHWLAFVLVTVLFSACEGGPSGIAETDDTPPAQSYPAASGALTLTIGDGPPIECFEDILVGNCGDDVSLILKAASLCGQVGMALVKWSAQEDCGASGLVLAFSCCPAESTCCWAGNQATKVPLSKCDRPLPGIACAAGAMVCCNTPSGAEVVAEAQCPFGSALDGSLCDGKCAKLSSEGKCADTTVWQDWAEGKCQLAGGAIAELEFTHPCSQKGVVGGVSALCCAPPKTCCKTDTSYVPANVGECPGDADVEWSFCEQAAKLSLTSVTIQTPNASNKPNYAWQCWDGKLQCTNWGAGVSSGHCSDLPKPVCKTDGKFLKPNYKWQCWNGKPRCTNWGVGVSDGYCQGLNKPDCAEKTKRLKPNYKWECWNGNAQCTNWGVGVSSGHCSDLTKPDCTTTTKPK